MGPLSTLRVRMCDGQLDRYWCFGNQSLKVEWMGEHLQPARGSRRPLFTGTIPEELDAILVGIAQERLTHAVVGCAVELDARSQRRRNASAAQPAWDKEWRD